MTKMRMLALAGAMLVLPAVAVAQSSPNWPFRYVPTAAEWNLWFAKKQDVIVGGAQSGLFSSSVTVNFGSPNTDTAIPITLPSGYTRWRPHSVNISGAQGNISTATAGLFTAASGGGIAIVTGGSSVTVTSSSSDTNNNAQTFTINNPNTIAYSDLTVYFRVASAAGSALNANVTVIYSILP